MRLLCALTLLANDLLFTALTAVFCGVVLNLTFGDFWTGAVAGTAIFIAVILFERDAVRSLVVERRAHLRTKPTRQLSAAGEVRG